MRVAVDRGKCESSGLCVAAAPAVFTLDADLLEIVDDSPADGLRGDVEAAIRACPTHALSLVE
jgi:ferredoxin